MGKSHDEQQLDRERGPSELAMGSMPAESGPILNFLSSRRLDQVNGRDTQKPKSKDTHKESREYAKPLEI